MLSGPFQLHLVTTDRWSYTETHVLIWAVNRFVVCPANGPAPLTDMAGIVAPGRMLPVPNVEGKR